MNISYSRVSSYLNCPYQHFLSYVKRLTPKKPVRPLRFGSDFHKLLENRIHPEVLPEVMEEIGDTYYSMPAHWQSELGDNYIQDLSTIFQDYMEIYADARLPKVTEQEFNIPLGNCRGETVYFKGIIDELYFTKSKATGKQVIRVGEHKTFTRRPDSMFLVMNTQKSLYSKACEYLYGSLPVSVIWDYIHSQPAEEPVWLEKSGRFSTAKSQKITPMSYRRACQRLGITEDSVVSEANNYAGNIPNFFFRAELEVIPKMTEDIWEGFKYTAKEIALRGDKNVTKNIAPTRCSFCDFKDLCYTELTGGDVSYILDKEFETKESKEENNGTSE